MPIFEALKVAILLLEANEQLPHESYRLTAKRVEQEWVFWFVFLPETPGKDITVFVSDDGSTRLLPGF